MTGDDVEFPAMPGTAHDFTIPCHLHLQRFVADHQARNDAATQGRAFVRAGVAQRVELAVDIEYADAAFFRFDDKDETGL